LEPCDEGGLGPLSDPMGRNKVKPEQASKVLMRMPTLRSFGEGRTCGEAIDKRTHAILAGDELAFDLVFSDVIMPGMNGVELATVIRERYPGLPVVLTSGYSSVLADNAHRGFELIQKPYSVEALSRILRKAISERSHS
jgi:DNA-binding NtrC family response regulator